MTKRQLIRKNSRLLRKLKQMEALLELQETILREEVPELFREAPEMLPRMPMMEEEQIDKTGELMVMLLEYLHKTPKPNRIIALSPAVLGNSH